VAASNQKETDIKDIPDIPNRIFEAVKNGRLVIFIGAGVSRIIGCPSWREFALLQLKDLYEKKVINYYEYKNLKTLDARKLLSICRRIYEENNISPQSMKSLMRGKDELVRKYRIYDDLYSFNAIYVTTNYDDYLDQVTQRFFPTSPVSALSKSSDHAEEDASRGKIVISKERLLVSSLTNGAVIHLHGSIKDESGMIITIVDYMRYYEKDSKPAVFLEELFSTYIVLFVGYGLEEYEILEFMISKSHLAKGETRHFMLYPIFKKESNIFDLQKKYYLDLGIQLVPYPIDEDGYENLAIVIHEWAKEIGPMSRPQGFLDRIKLIDEVL